MFEICFQRVPLQFHFDPSTVPPETADVMLQIKQVGISFTPMCLKREGWRLNGRVVVIQSRSMIFPEFCFSSTTIDHIRPIFAPLRMCI